MRWYQRALFALAVGSWLTLQIVMILNNEDQHWGFDARPVTLAIFAILLAPVGLVWLVATLIDRRRFPRLTIDGRPIEKPPHAHARHR